MTPVEVLEPTNLTNLTHLNVESRTALPAPTQSTTPRALPQLGRAAQGHHFNRVTFFFMAAFHLGAIAALFFFSWTNLFVLIGLWIVAINLGIGVCYHRLLTHRGFRTPQWVEHTLAVFATLALEGGPIFWVGTHRVHHQFSDQEGDPHTPYDGLWWSHAGWIVSGVPLHAETALLAKYAPDLARDRFYLWLSKYHWIPLVMLGLLLLAIGGWKMVLWGVFLRVTLGLHATWMVNSLSHTFGGRRFRTRDDSRNNLFVALLTGGEGWHNNHHAHPVSARHGLAWYEFDPNYYAIRLMSKLGLASHIKVAAYDRHNPVPAADD